MGGTGNDTLVSTGASGTSESNIYVFSTGDGNDTISDAAGVSDIIYMKIGSTALSTFRAYDNNTTSPGGDLVIDYDGGQIKVLNHFGGTGASIEQIRFEGGSFAGYAFDAANPYSVGNGDPTTGIRGATAGTGHWLGAGEQGASNTINGATANDLLFGGDQNDVLQGNAGRDLLFGGAGADTYKFVTTGDSGITIATSDVIADFVEGLAGGIDKIDLFVIDADTVTVGDQGFAWGGENNAVAAGSVTWSKDSVNNRTVIQMDTADADTSINMLIVLNGLHNLQQSDFVL
jgi:Ca2+-binding RTX toxin-like protein